MFRSTIQVLKSLASTNRLDSSCRGAFCCASCGGGDDDGDGDDGGRHDHHDHDHDHHDHDDFCTVLGIVPRTYVLTKS